MFVTKLGHSAMLIETPDARLLIDPGNISTDWHAVRDLDAVLVTHQHPDHCDPENLHHLLEANRRAVLIAEPQTADKLATFEPRRAAVGDIERVGDVEVEMLGGEHALIHPEVPRIGNIGYLVAERDGPRLFHPGDSYETTPTGVDVLALPVTAPWARVETMVDFLKTVAPVSAIPIHDAIVNDIGRSIYMRWASNLKPGTTDLADPAVGDRYEIEFEPTGT